MDWLRKNESGHSNEHILGVRICLSSSVAKALAGWKPVNETIVAVRFQTRHAKAHTIPKFRHILQLWKLMITRNIIITKIYRTL